MEYTENTVICNCKHVTLADIDNALQRSAHFSDVEKEFAEVQKLTSCSTGCGGCHDKNICGYVYDPELGDPDNGVAPGTPWEEVPEDWTCPLCSVGKDQFSPEE